MGTSRSSYRSPKSRVARNVVMPSKYAAASAVRTALRASVASSGGWSMNIDSTRMEGISAGLGIALASKGRVEKKSWNRRPRSLGRHRRVLNGVRRPMWAAWT